MENDNILPNFFRPIFEKNLIHNSDKSYTWSIWPDRKELVKLVLPDKLQPRENISIYHFTISNR